jgi:hypothetical protein
MTNHDLGKLRTVLLAERANSDPLRFRAAPLRLLCGHENADGDGAERACDRVDNDRSDAHTSAGARHDESLSTRGNAAQIAAHHWRRHRGRVGGVGRSCTSGRETKARLRGGSRGSPTNTTATSGRSARARRRAGALQESIRSDRGFRVSSRDHSGGSARCCRQGAHGARARSRARRVEAENPEVSRPAGASTGQP